MWLWHISHRDVTRMRPKGSVARAHHSNRDVSATSLHCSRSRILFQKERIVQDDDRGQYDGRQQHDQSSKSHPKNLTLSNNQTKLPLIIIQNILSVSKAIASAILNSDLLDLEQLSCATSRSSKSIQGRLARDAHGAENFLSTNDVQIGCWQHGE
ncbi:hypothetical protein E2P81_ATG02059 [Venturia nashicola]|nr:hypothetical protein E2P81_ATG02059 [Venturia nashicola]